jgi:hypothetical protein
MVLYNDSELTTATLIQVTHICLSPPCSHGHVYRRNNFREDFKIDCVLIHADQEAELYTDRGQHVWMVVTDWTKPATKEGIEYGMASFNSCNPNA